MESSRLIIGSTGSGKSEGELVELVRLADAKKCAVVLLDGHGPLAFKAAGHWIARGHEHRVVYEPLRVTDRVLQWSCLSKSLQHSAADRSIEDSQTQDEVSQCFLAARDVATLRDRPWTKEWLEASIRLCLSQPQEEPLTSLLAAFHAGSSEYERLLRAATGQDITGKFRDLEAIKRRNPVQYETLTGPARRLLELVCTSEIVRLRARPADFDWLHALQKKQLIAFDGGGVRSTEIKRTLFLLVSLQVIHAVRRHFTLSQRPLPVVLVLEEAGSHDLVSPFVLRGMQELRKAGLAIHVLTQSSLDFADPKFCEALLSHAPWQAWYQCLSPADQDLGARALANATFDPHEVHFSRTRQLHHGTTRVASATHGHTFDPWGKLLREDRRHGHTVVPRYVTVTDDYYKSPQLHEQEFRTQLATLRVGERFVRDRVGVDREQVTMLPPPRPLNLSDRCTHEAIDRIRRQPIYHAVEESPPQAPPHRRGAAEILRERTAGTSTAAAPETIT